MADIRIMKLLQHLLLITVLANLAGCATNPVTGDQDFVLMSEQEEISLGRNYHKQILQEMPAYKDPALTAYVNQVGQRVARVSHRAELDFHFTVVDSPQVNAFALPGGYVYVNRGLLAYLDSEAELAAVLGHEVGHVTARHGVRQQSASTAAGVAGAILQATTGVQGSQDLFNVFGKAILSGYGREHELESDRLGAQYLARAGYDPQAMLDVIGVLKNQEIWAKQLAREKGTAPANYHGVFASHPDNDRRLQEVVGEASHLKTSNTPRIGRQEYLQQMEGLTYGPGEDEGVVRGNRFLHKPLNFGLTFPERWKIANQTDRLIATDPGQKGFIEITIDPRPAKLTPARFMKKKGLKDLRGGSAFKVGKFSGYTGTAPVKISQGQRLARFTVLFDDNNAFLFSGVSIDPRQRQKFDKQFLAIARSFRRLSAAERKQASARHLHLVKAKAGTRMADLARKSPLREHAEEQLRLLNNLYPEGEPEAGQTLKLVR